MSIQSDIRCMRTQLISKWVKHGLYEDFGQKEVRDLKDKHDYLSLCWGTMEQRADARLLDNFSHWCMNYTKR